MAIEALIFDVFGTCVDWRGGVAGVVDQQPKLKAAGIDAFAFADDWRGRYQPAMAKIRSGARRYVDLDVLHRENLEATLDAFGLAGRLDEIARADLNRAWEKLPPWPDVGGGLDRLRRRFVVAPCSNGSIALMVRLARFGGLPWDCILGAGIARAYKPDTVVYLRSCEALRLAPQQVAMVAAHNGDLAAARDAGLATAFVARPSEHGAGQETELEASSDWDFVASDFLDLAAQLGT